MKIVKPRDAEVEAVLEKCGDLAEGGRDPFFGMTYAQGVKAAIEWMLEGGENPLEE